MHIKSLTAFVLSVCLLSVPANAAGILKGTSTSKAPATSTTVPAKQNGILNGSTAGTATGTAVQPKVAAVGRFGERYAYVGQVPIVLPPENSEIPQPKFTKQKDGSYQASYSIDSKKQYSANDQQILSIINSWNQNGGEETIQVSTKSGTKSVTGTFDHRGAKAIFMSVNEKRAAAKLPALSWNAALYTAAKQRAAETSVYNSHTRPDGSSYTTAGSGINGENIADGYANTQVAMNEWMQSSGHKANILRSTFKDFAAAVFKAGNHPYYVQEFGGY